MGFSLVGHKHSRMAHLSFNMLVLDLEHNACFVLYVFKIICYFSAIPVLPSSVTSTPFFQVPKLFEKNIYFLLFTSPFCHTFQDLFFLFKLFLFG